MSCKKQAGTDYPSWTPGFIPCFVNTWIHPLFREHLGSSPVSWTPWFIPCFVNTWVHPLFRGGVRGAHLFSFLCCVFVMLLFVLSCVQCCQYILGCYASLRSVLCPMLPVYLGLTSGLELWCSCCSFRLIISIVVLSSVLWRPLRFLHYVRLYSQLSDLGRWFYCA